jgi:hypothetical protein
MTEPVVAVSNQTVLADEANSGSDVARVLRFFDPLRVDVISEQAT